MKSRLCQWEHGSEFHLAMEWGGGGGPDLPADADLYGSGRDALRSLLTFGSRVHGWRTLWVPSYFCQTVIRDISMPGLEVRAYGDGPLDSERDPVNLSHEGPGTVLTLNPFGLRTEARPLILDRSRHWVIEDHTHDPWSPMVRRSSADYCFASLRKTIPIPDGGMLWSPIGRPLPSCPPPTKERTVASTWKLAGMALKGLYVDGHHADKALFRGLLVAGEANIASGDISGMPYRTRDLLQGFSARAWRDRRIRNHAEAVMELQGCPDLKIIGATSKECAPFTLFLVLSTEGLRNGLRQNLIDSHIFPAVLWSLEAPAISQIREIDLDLSRRSLCLHCDARYRHNNMVRVADAIQDYMRS